MHNNSVEVRGSSTYINLDEERINGSRLGSKRAHIEMSSPRNEKLSSPSSNSEADAGVTGNGFVTARTKLVSIVNVQTPSYKLVDIIFKRQLICFFTLLFTLIAMHPC